MRKIFLISMLILFVFCSTGYAELIDNGDGTVTDTKTGLMWQKTAAENMNWEAALAYCKGLEIAGHSDWRLPDIRELQALFDSIYDNPIINKTVFPDISYTYWSSNISDIKSKSLMVSFYPDDGSVYPGDKHNRQGLRAVRGGQ